jgi:hypothetical protein
MAGFYIRSTSIQKRAVLEALVLQPIIRPQYKGQCKDVAEFRPLRKEYLGHPDLQTQNLNLLGDRCHRLAFPRCYWSPNLVPDAIISSYSERMSASGGVKCLHLARSSFPR